MIPDDECKSVPKTTRTDVCYMKLNLFVFFFSFCTRGDDYGACRYVENVGGYVILHSHFCLCFMHLFQNLNTLAIFFSFSPSASFKVKAKENLLNLLNQYIIIVNMKFVSNWIFNDHDKQSHLFRSLSVSSRLYVHYYY